MFDLAIALMSQKLKRVIRFQPRQSGTCFLPALEQMPAPILNPSLAQPAVVTYFSVSYILLSIFHSSLVASPAVAASTIIHSFHFMCVINFLHTTLLPITNHG